MLGAHASLRAERESAKRSFALNQLDFRRGLSRREAFKKFRWEINFRVMEFFYAAKRDVARKDACAPSDAFSAKKCALRNESFQLCQRKNQNREVGIVGDICRILTVARSCSF